MSTATPTTSSTPAQAQQAHQAGARPAHLHGQRLQAPTDLFATLLALAADATPAEAGDPLAAAADTAAQGDGQDADDQDNPLAGLMFWHPPGPLEQAHAASAAGDSAQGGRATTTPERAVADALREPSARSTRNEEPAAAAPDAATAPATSLPATARPSGPSWQVMASRAAQTAPAGTGGDAPATRWTRAAPETSTHAQAWSLRSTVTLDPRFPASAQSAPGMAQATTHATAHAALHDHAEEIAPATTGERAHAGSAAPAAPATASGPASQADMSGSQTDSGDGGDAGSATPDNGGQSEDTRTAYARDAEAVEVQHWGGAHGLRHASLRVGEEAARAIDIQLALRGDEVQLDIRTDDSAARDALREQAQAALGERLQQGGLQLGSVSVGAQNQERPHEGHGPALPQGRTAGDATAETAAEQPPRASARAGGLDLFI